MQFQFRLDEASGVPVYRQIIDQVAGGIAVGALQPGQQLPTVRQLAVDLCVNPNTVVRAYRELEIRGILVTQQGSGTFIGSQQLTRDERERQRSLDQFVSDLLARAGQAGFTAREVSDRLQAALSESRGKKEKK